jgi:hypothetical protein
MIAACLLFGPVTSVLAMDPDHFLEVKVPPDEAHALALTGVREFSCSYQVLPPPLLRQNPPGSEFNYQQDLQLFAELYEGTSCVGRYRLASSVNAFNGLNLPLKGALSFGWNSRSHELVSVIDNGQFYSPWSASAIFKDFSCRDHSFFENSAPEKRQRMTSEGPDFEIYPVVGICGDRRLKMQKTGFANAASFLKACQNAGAANAVVIYLYKGGGSVPLKFHQPFFKSHLWLPVGLCFVSVLAAITFLLHYLTMRSKIASKGEI